MSTETQPLTPTSNGTELSLLSRESLEILVRSWRADATRKEATISALKADLAKAREALGFVPPRVEKDAEGEVLVSDDAYENLGGAIIDLEHLNADMVAMDTLRRVEEQLYKAREALGGPQRHKRERGERLTSLDSTKAGGNGVTEGERSN